MSNEVIKQIESLNQEVEGLYNQGKYKQAIVVCEQACNLARNNGLTNHPDYAQSLNNLALLYSSMGRYSEAEPLHQEATEIRKKALKKDHLDYAESLNNLALQYYSMEQYAEAEPLYKEAKEIREKALGTDHPDYAQSLNNLAMLYHSMGRYEEVEPLYKEAKEIRKNTLGDNHPDYATILNNLAGFYHSMGRYAEAEPLYKEAKEIWKNTLGDNHLDYASSLNNLADLYKSMGQYAEAEPLHQQAKEIWKNALGTDHRNYASSLNNLAELYDSMGRYAEAERLHQESKEIREKAFGTDHPFYATSLNNLAGFYHSMGRYAEAEPLYQAAKDIRKKALGDDHPLYAQSLNNLAGFYQSMGRYTEAEPLYQAAKDIREKALGTDHPEYAVSLNNLARFYQSMGRYAEAEPLYIEAKDIRKKALGTDHPEYAASLNNLALLYYFIEREAEAEPLYQESLEILKKVFGTDHRNYAASLNNLALLYDSMERYTEAEPLYQEALEIWKKALGTDHPEYANSLNNLACLYESMGRYLEAEPLYQEALEIWKKALGTDHPEYARPLDNLAGLYYSMGRYAEAEPLYQKAKEIWKKALGDNHPDYAITLTNLAKLKTATDRPLEALTLMEEAAKIELQLIGQIFTMSSDRQRQEYLAENYSQLEIFLSLVSQYLSNSAFNLVLRRKALATEAAIMQKIAIFSGRYPHLTPKLEKMRQLGEQITKLSFDIPAKEQLPTYQETLASLKRQQEELEREITREIPEMNLQKQLQNIDRRAVALALPEGATLVEFVRFYVFNFKAIPAQGESRWQPVRYLAFILPAGKPERVEMIDLGEAKTINKLIGVFRENVSGGRGWNTNPTQRKEENGQKKEELSAKIFQPIKPYLSSRLFLSPDGQLNTLPFELIEIEEGKYLMEEYQLSYLSVGRDVLRFKFQIPAEVTAPLVIANPDYNLGFVPPLTPPYQGGEGFVPPLTSSYLGDAEKQVFPPLSKGGLGGVNTPLSKGGLGGVNSTSTTERVYREIATSRGGGMFPRLPGTEIEGQEIAAFLGVKPDTDVTALKSKVSKCLQSPRIVHIATHGYFLKDIEKQRPDSHNTLSLASRRLFGAAEYNPLLRAGLVFAGVNTMLSGGKLPPEAEDGLLSAADVVVLELAGTELVVASACQTALGDIKIGESVGGLRRAFMLAGAKTLVMSLWNVPDVATAILMQRYYQYVLNDKLGRAEALQQAKYYVRDLTVGEMRQQWLTEEAISAVEKHSQDAAEGLRRLSQFSDNYRPYEHPKYWGAFVCIGNPDPM